MSTYLRIAGIVISTIGTLLLAWRGTRLLDALEKASWMYESNFRSILARLNGEPQRIPYSIGSNALLDEVKPLSKFLLWLGFALIIIGNALVGLSWYIEA